MLTLAEELLLLALDDESGSVEPAASGSLQYGLAGALLVELVIAGRLRLEGGGLVVADGSPTGDAVLDEVIGRISRSGRPRDAEYWVGQFGRLGPNDVLIKACDLTDEVFHDGERERAHARLDAIARDELIGKAVSGAVSRARAADQFAAQAAAAGAVVSATSSCSTGSSC
jgi:hypothetical protein